jgi:hypothetical protein
MQCNWCEIASRSADLIGFIGALLLGYPFLFGQASRDTLMLLSNMTVGDIKDQTVVNAARRDLLAEISRKSRIELRFAWIGAGFIGLAFILKFVTPFF